MNTPLLTIFVQNPTVLRLSTIVDASSRKEICTDLCIRFESDYVASAGALPEGISHIFPCSHTQEGILSQFLMSEGSLYFNYFILEIPPHINEAALHEAWKKVFAKYDILRTGFIELAKNNDYSYAQMVYESPQLNWTVSYTDDIFPHANFQSKKYSKIALQNLELPQLFLEFARQSDGKNFLLFAANHAVFDAKLLVTILDEVYLYCEAEDSCEQSPRQLSTYKDTLNEILSTQQYSSSKSAEFWQNMLASVSITHIPNMHSITNKDLNISTKTIEQKLGLSLPDLQIFSAQSEVSVHSLGIAAWSKVRL